jgi:hypothetical protein
LARYLAVRGSPKPVRRCPFCQPGDPGDLRVAPLPVALDPERAGLGFDAFGGVRVNLDRARV